MAETHVCDGDVWLNNSTRFVLFSIDGGDSEMLVFVLRFAKFEIVLMKLKMSVLCTAQL